MLPFYPEEGSEEETKRKKKGSSDSSVKYVTATKTLVCAAYQALKLIQSGKVFSGFCKVFSGFCWENLILIVF